MSELEEPPAKVLKIDSIDGVTKVTELDELPSAGSITDENEAMADESDVVEGGVEGIEQDVQGGMITEGQDGTEHEGQEEWLSEGILTDDDYNPASQEPQGDHTDSQLGTSQEEDHLDSTFDSETSIPDNKANAEIKESDITMNDESLTDAEDEINNLIQSNDPLQTSNANQTSSKNVTEKPNSMAAENKANMMKIDENISKSVNVTDAFDALKEVKDAQLNIEETMKHLDGSKEDVKANILGNFLVKKKEVKNEPKTVKEVKQVEDDGNDTDDLLRMLGEDDTKTKKKLTKTVKDIKKVVNQDEVSTDDDDFVYEGTKAKKLKAAKSVLSKKQTPIKALPERFDDEESNMSEAESIQNIFGLSKTKSSKRIANQKTSNAAVKRQPQRIVVNVVDNPTVKRTLTPVKQYQNKRITKPSVVTKQATAAKPVGETKQTPAISKVVKKEPETNGSVKPEIKTPAPFKPATTVKGEDKKKGDRAKIDSFDMDEIIDGEEFLDDDEFDLDDDEFGESDIDDKTRSRQRIMRPEVMDEEVPSDADSHNEDGSLYDEMPSSDSEDMDDWFTLDIRAESAAEYIPLLGSRAKEILLEEKSRVLSRMQTLKQSLTALTDSGKKQADQLRQATMSLAELDDLLKAS